MGGSSASEGRLEIYYGGAWGTVCDDSWDATDAGVVCRMLGFDGPSTATSMASFGEGTGEIQMDNVACTGQESSIGDCPHNGWRSHNCRHSEDAGVICSMLQGNNKCYHGTDKSIGYWKILVDNF